MGDEKPQAPPGDKKQDKPPSPVQQQPPKDQHTGPARAADQKQPLGSRPANDHPKATPAGQTAAMQQSVGNQQVNRIMRATREPRKDPHAPGTKVSHPEDAAEKEAEAVAKKVTGDQPAHPHDHPGPAPGDPAKVVGDPSAVHGDPDVVHRVVANHDKATKPRPTATHPTAPQHPAPAGPSPTSILDHPGPGQPIPQPTRSTLEARLKADLSHVVVHHDAQADRAVRTLHAKAVTRGNHIFLASDASPYDLSLMAHEVTHVLHHNNDTVHRAPDTTPPALAGTPTGKFYDGPEGFVDTVPTPDKDGATKKTVEIATVPFADAKRKHSGIKVDADFAAGSRIVGSQDSEQNKKWRDGIERDQTTAAIETLLQDTATIPAPPPGEPAATGRSALYILRFGAAGSAAGAGGAVKALNGVIVGNKADLISAALLPVWDQNRKFNPMNIDHAVELQVGGADNINNYWLWDAVANQHSGTSVKSEIITQVNALLTAARKGKTEPIPVGPNRASLGASEWRIKVRALGGGLPLNGNPYAFWTRNQVASGKPAKQLSAVTLAEAQALGLNVGESANFLTIVVTGGTLGSGGAIVRVPWKSGQMAAGPAAAQSFREVYPRLKVTNVVYDKNDPTATSNVFEATVTNKRDQTLKLPIKLPLVGFKRKTGGMMVAQLSGQNLAKAVGGAAHFKPLSLFTISEAELVPYTGFYARGILQPSIPLLCNTSIDVVLSGDDILFQKSFDAKNLPAPAPIKITGGGILISAGTDGFQIGGTLNVALGTVATGRISAAVDASLNFSLCGSIDFDSTLFKPANLEFTYQKQGSDYQWGVGGNLGIPPNKVPGIQQGTIHASYSNGVFAASGDAKLSVPGLDSGTLQITYSERDGVMIGGTFGFKPNPVIESGSVSATVTKRPPGNRWAVSANGTVKPKIPGVDATLSASYEDGVFTVEGSVAYARGLLSGSLTVGLTNRPLDAQGHPGGAPRAGAPLRPYGGGTLTVRIAPWLQGTVGVQLQADGSVQMMGEIALPDSVSIFNAMQVQKNLLNIGVDIPIVGVAVMGHRIGIFATIQGGLDASAGIGPGQLRQLSLRVRYNPEHEDQTQITGGAQLFVPAHAGLRLYVRGALGAGIPIVSAEAGLEIGGQLGVEGAVQAGVTLNWTPKQGLVIDAQASLSAEPSFTFDINGYVKVGADLILTTVTLYEKHWQLASFRYGSGLRVGVRAPIHYEQGKPFTFSLSDVQFELPKIDPMEVLTDLVHKIA